MHSAGTQDFRGKTEQSGERNGAIIISFGRNFELSLTGAVFILAGSIRKADILPLFFIPREIIFRFLAGGRRDFECED